MLTNTQKALVAKVKVSNRAFMKPNRELFVRIN